VASTPEGMDEIRALLSNWDVLDDYDTFLDKPMEEGSFMGGVDLGSNKEDFELADENAFEDLMRKYNPI
jgi:hypothetical protein